MNPIFDAKILKNSTYRGSQNRNKLNIIANES